MIDLPETAKGLLCGTELRPGVDEKFREKRLHLIFHDIIGATSAVEVERLRANPSSIVRF